MVKKQHSPSGTPEQPELNFDTPRDPERHERLDELIALLTERGRMTAKELKQAGFSDRELRVIVESDTEGQILSFPGSKGYALFDQSPFEDILRAPDAMISQGKKMIRRGLIYSRRKHTRVRPRGDAPRDA